MQHLNLQPQQLSHLDLPLLLKIDHSTLLLFSMTPNRMTLHHLKKFVIVFRLLLQISYTFSHFPPTVYFPFIKLPDPWLYLFSHLFLLLIDPWFTHLKTLTSLSHPWSSLLFFSLVYLTLWFDLTNHLLPMPKVFLTLLLLQILNILMILYFFISNLSLSTVLLILYHQGWQSTLHQIQLTLRLFQISQSLKIFTLISHQRLLLFGNITSPFLPLRKIPLHYFIINSIIPSYNHSNNLISHEERSQQKPTLLRKDKINRVLPRHNWTAKKNKRKNQRR